MPKRSASARSGAQRKAKAQKNIELVRQASTIDEERSEPEIEEQEEKETVGGSVATMTSAEKKRANEVERAGGTPPKGSAAARLAARRLEASRKAQQRAATLITPEHFAYVQRDLITVAVLAVVMIAIILANYYFLVIRA